MSLGVRQDEVVHHLDGGWTVGEDQRGGAERVEQVLELDRHDRLLRRKRHEIQPRIDDEPEGALGADHDAREVDGP